MSLPVTFHIKEGLDDNEFSRFKHYYEKAEEEIKSFKANSRSPTIRDESEKPEEQAKLSAK